MPDHPEPQINENEADLPFWSRPGGLALALLVPAALLALAVVQFSTPTLWDADGYYHARMAEVLRTQGPIRSLHWAKYSFLATRYADKDLLYHVLLAPFTLFPSIFTGAKVAAVLSAALLLGVYLFLLKRYASPQWAPPFLALFLASDHFLAALSRPRPMILAIALMLLGVHFLVQRRLRAAFLVTLVYGYLHITALILVVFALVIEAVRALDQGKFSLRPAAAAGAGLAASYFLHPHFPNNLLVIKLNLFLVPYYAAKTGVLELGAEFFPMLTRDYFFSYPAVPLLALALLFLAMHRGRYARFETKASLACAAPLLVGSLLSQRYAVHAYPLVLLCGAMHWDDLTDGLTVERRRKTTGWVAACAVLAVLAGLTASRVRRAAEIERIVNGHYERVGRWMAQNIPPGETVFHANWSDSQFFIGLNPQNDYFVTLDPIYMYAWNPELYRIYRDLAHGRTADPYAVLRDVFHVRYGYAGKNYFGKLIQQMIVDPRFQVLAEDPQGLVFKLR